ncbi:glucose/quinate/shikimate family membrane-bound PQQ-dependent dehydrogenase [Acinetobacter rathckeae]|uniref:glucose/quinate/shikimate family membrane-bound PQQ-dependent dehydrogenase n=1 Tax=Acinetobacter rathckeae TaxID=2605272 RepID=UPI0018A317E1|nr:glucose/quinate/shikimate family membrane-bound PQQ-dependent dehydrogenase [Acinetobacter rathckeae]MBF7687140.1 glucose/quinate/shikimate family membrane-bound PQQ-dependent dehydrogenase [Acinetobacter rathckeae]MBF7694508.1 glucose/quinate/shikimate family membrane-bound PQQ-dependent dehydrogenase [Acinetobacter rathckeae]
MELSSRDILLNKVIAFIFIFIGIVVLASGIYLIVLGGSYYYLIAGLMFLVTGFMLSRQSSLAFLSHALLMFATTLWGLWEVGSDFWALVPRVDVIGVLGLILFLPSISRVSRGQKKKYYFCLASTLIFTILTLIYSIFNDPQEVSGKVENTQPKSMSSHSGVADEDWPAYGRTQAGQRFSPLDQINDKNIKNLKEAWVLRTKDLKTAADPVEITNEVTPIKIGNNMYICTAHQKLIAINPETGQEKWQFDPKLKSDISFQHVMCRGVSYFDQDNTSEFETSLKNNHSSSIQCPKKVILPVNDGRLIAVNAETGQPCTDFGKNGEVDLQKDMPYPYPGGYNPTSPPIVTGTTIIIAGSVTDNYSTKEPSGVIRGYDVNTGKLLWVFDTGAKDPNAIPASGQTFVNNSPNAWAPLSYDEKADIVYIPTGSGTPDVWGGDRTSLKERYANSILALNASTGKLLWAFQTTHHDLWDMDVPAQPTLADIKDKTGNIIPTVYIPTKTGNIFVLNRYTGQPITPIHERPVPQSVKKGPQTKGEWYSKTQPYSDLNLAPKEKLTDKDMWGATLFDQLYCRIYFKTLNYEGNYTPPSENGTLVFPGNLGVLEWGGISINVDRQIATMNTLALPFVSKLIPKDPNRKEEKVGSSSEHGIRPMYGIPYAASIGPFLSPLGLPCKQPGWGYISSVDLKTNQVIWKKRVGTIRDSLPKMFQLPPLKIGVPGLGGAISTAGNIMILGATQDNYIRAFNVTTGEQLWQARLPAGGQATPMTYAINGKQYIVIMAGGHGSFGTKMGDYLIAYTLDK